MATIQGPRIEYVPQDKQKLLHGVPATEVLYGGAVGGGKSYALLWEAFMWALEVPDVQIYLFRRSYPELERTHIMTSQREFPSEFMQGKQKVVLCTWIEGKKRWKFYNGSTISFCHVSDEGDELKYRSEEMHLLLIDELTSFSENMYTFLRTRVRMNERMKDTLPKKFRGALPAIKCASNPGDLGHEWVKRYFVDECEETVEWGKWKTKRMPRHDGGMVRAYIPAKLEDNKFLSTEEYEGRIYGFHDEVMAQALRHGRWDIFAGQAFPELSKEVHGLEPFDWSGYDNVYMALDWGYAQPFSVGWYVSNFDNDLIRIYEWYGRADPKKPQSGMRMTVEEVAEGIKEREADLGIRVKRRIGGVDLFRETGLGDKKGLVGQTFAEEFSKHGLRFIQADTRRRMGKQQFHLRFQYERGKDGEITRHPKFYAITKNNPWFWKMLPNMVLDEKTGNEDVSQRQEDHLYEEVRYMLMARPLGSHKPKDRYPRWSLKHIDDTLQKANRKSRRSGSSASELFRKYF